MFCFCNVISVVMSKKEKPRVIPNEFYENNKDHYYGMYSEDIRKDQEKLNMPYGGKRLFSKKNLAIYEKANDKLLKKLCKDAKKMEKRAKSQLFFMNCYKM